MAVIFLVKLRMCLHKRCRHILEMHKNNDRYCYSLLSRRRKKHEDDKMAPSQCSRQTLLQKVEREIIIDRRIELLWNGILNGIFRRRKCLNNEHLNSLIQLVRQFNIQNDLFLSIKDFYPPSLRFFRTKMAAVH